MSGIRSFAGCPHPLFQIMWYEAKRIWLRRNFALYKPKAWEDVTKSDVEQELQKIRNNLKILVGLL